MTCREVLDLVEPIASGDMDVTAAIRDHIESCPGCAAALASARRLEAALAGRPAPEAPVRFTPEVVARVRRERWRAEQTLDRVFNLAIAAAVVLIVGGVLALANVGTVLDGASHAGAMLTAAIDRLARQAAPAVTTYLAAIGLLASALLMWWWAERRLSL